MTIGDIVTKQFTQMWGMLREAIEKCPEEQWKVGNSDWQIPARLACHVVEGADYHARATPEGYSPTSRFSAYWEIKPEQLADKDQVLIHLNEVQAQVGNWLSGMEDSDLLSPNSGFPLLEDAWESVLGRILSLLRHAQHHLGQLNADLRRRGLPTAKWQ